VSASKIGKKYLLARFNTVQPLVGPRCCFGPFMARQIHIASRLFQGELDATRGERSGEGRGTAVLPNLFRVFVCVGSFLLVVVDGG